MAIIIPSKNIYEINNPKIRDNIIDNVSVEQTGIKPNNEYEVSVYNEKFYGFELSTSSSDLAIASVAEQSSGSYWEAISYVRVTPKYKKNIEIVINALKNNYFVSKVYDGEKTNEDGTKEANIKYSIEYRKYSGDITGNATLNKAINPYESESRVIENSPYNITEQQNVGEIPKLKQTNENSFSRNGYVGNNKALAEITEISDETNLANIKFNLENDIYIPNDTATILSGIEIIKLGNVINNADIDEMGSTRNLSGSYEKYEPLSIEITIYGNTIGIDLTDGSVTYGSGNKPYSLGGNELLQDSGKVGETALTKHLADNVLTQYAKGKETATLLCDINDYYEKGTNFKLVSANNPKNLVNIPYIKGGYNSFYYEDVSLPLKLLANQTYTLSFNYKIKTDNTDIQCTVGFGNGYTTDIAFMGYNLGEQSTDGYYYGRFVGTFDTSSVSNDETFKQNPQLWVRFVLSSSPNTVTYEISNIMLSFGANDLPYERPTMLFEISDEVIPYVFGANGQDQPMSKYQNGLPKVFEVVGTNIIYDGAVWQELTLLEKTS